MLEKQLTFFKNHKSELLSKYPGKYLVISEDLNVFPFDSMEDAYIFGESSFGLGKFLLKDCSWEQQNKVHRILPNIVFA